MRLRSLVAVLGMVAVACSTSTPRLPPPGAVPIVFVHGYGTSAAVFDTMIDHLESMGYPPDHLVAVDLLPPEGANVAAARDVIGPAVEALTARTGAPTVDVVAHSMGALSARFYAAELAPERVRSLITVAGANHGTDALCGYGTPGGDDLCPAFSPAGGSVQGTLNGAADAPADETPFGRGADPPGVPAVAADGLRSIRYVAVLVPDDRWIVPGASSELAGADPVTGLPADVAVRLLGPGNLLFGEPTDHDAILADGRFLRVLDAVLAGAERPG